MWGFGGAWSWKWNYKNMVFLLGCILIKACGMVAWSAKKY